MSGAISPLPQHAFMVWCSVKAQGQLYLYLYLTCCGIAFSAVVTFFLCLHYPEIFVPLRRTLFSEISTSLSVPNQGTRAGVPFQ
jgi:hypothetical protein